MFVLREVEEVVSVVKEAEQRVLLLQLGLGDGGLRLDHGRDDGRRIRALGDRRLDVLAELLLVHGKARGLVREGKGLGLRVELFDRGVLCGTSMASATCWTKASTPSAVTTQVRQQSPGAARAGPRPCRMRSCSSPSLA